jgi:hypothetical protein
VSQQRRRTSYYLGSKVMQPSTATAIAKTENFAFAKAVVGETTVEEGLVDEPEGKGARWAS